MNTQWVVGRSSSDAEEDVSEHSDPCRRNFGPDSALDRP